MTLVLLPFNRCRFTESHSFRYPVFFPILTGTFWSERAAEIAMTVLSDLQAPEIWFDDSWFMMSIGVAWRVIQYLGRLFQNVAPRASENTAGELVHGAMEGQQPIDCEQWRLCCLSLLHFFRYFGGQMNAWGRIFKNRHLGLWTHRVVDGWHGVSHLNLEVLPAAIPSHPVACRRSAG